MKALSIVRIYSNPGRYASVAGTAWPHSTPSERLSRGPAIAINQSNFGRDSVRSDRLQEKNDVTGEPGALDHRPQPDGRLDARESGRELRRVALSPGACLWRNH